MSCLTFLQHVIYNLTTSVITPLFVLQERSLALAEVDSSRAQLQDEANAVTSRHKKEQLPLTEKLDTIRAETDNLMNSGQDQTPAFDALLEEESTCQAELDKLVQAHQKIKLEVAAKCRAKLEEYVTLSHRLTPEIQEARNNFISSVTSAWATPTPAPDSNTGAASSSKRTELFNNIRKVESEVRQLTATHAKSEEEDYAKYIGGTMSQDQYDTRQAERSSALKDAKDEVARAKQAFQEFSQSAKQVAPPPTALGKLNLAPRKVSVPAKPLPKAPAMAAPAPARRGPSAAPSRGPSTAASRPHQPAPAPPARSDSLGLSGIALDASAAGSQGNVTLDVQRQLKLLEKQKRLFLEAQQRKKRKDYYEEPHLTGLSKLRMVTVAELYQEMESTDNYNSLHKPVDPRNGDLYIYKAGSRDPVLLLDNQPWKHDGLDIRKCEKLFPGRKFEQATFIKSDADKDTKKIVLSDNINGIQIVHYRGKVNAAPGLKPPSTSQDIEDRDKINQLLTELADQPRDAQPRDYRTQIMPAIAQFSCLDDFSTHTVQQYMDDIRERENANLDNTRVRHPKGGDVFVFDVSTITITCLYSLSDDGYAWSSRPPLGCDGLKKRSFWFRPPGGQALRYDSQESSFKKTIYYRERDQTCLIHYRGDHTTAQHKLKYRSGKEQEACRMIIQQRIREVDPHRTKGPSQVFQELGQAFPSQDNGVLLMATPATVDQVRYYQRKDTAKKLVEGSELINIGFLDRIFGQKYIVNHSGHPHKLFFMAHNQSLANMKHLLKTLVNKDQPLILHFDTTFKFGNYYLSPLIYRHPQVMLKARNKDNECDDAIVPLVHILHENKSHASLNNFFFWFNQLMDANCPEFQDWPKVLVSDREFRDTYLPNTKRVYCKIHILKDLERHAMGLGMKKKRGNRSIQYYKQCIDNLICSETLDDYNASRDALFYSNKMWTCPEGQALAEYYKKNLEKDIIERCGYWYLESLGLGHMLRGMTNNPSETYNSMIRHLKPKGNARQTADITAIRLFSYECSLHNYILSAYYGYGKFF